jgi:6-hydroxycyclohex-1-ene-1-carbonyl-CoA dehydrogenase
VVALDVDAARLERAGHHGASLTLVAEGDARVVRERVLGWAKDKNLPRTGWKIFETSGHPAGQELAFSLLGPDGHLGIVGFTREKVSLRLSNLMAFDATARGTWGCLPEHYPAVVDLVTSGKVLLGPFVERRPMSSLPETFEALRRHELVRRPVMIPDFS